MAELNLYGNTTEPAFPFYLVKDKLQWLKQLSSQAEENWDEWERVPDRLNIVLVMPIPFLLLYARHISMAHRERIG